MVLFHPTIAITCFSLSKSNVYSYNQLQSAMVYIIVISYNTVRGMFGLKPEGRASLKYNLLPYIRRTRVITIIRST